MSPSVGLTLAGVSSGGPGKLLRAMARGPHPGGTPPQQTKKPQPHTKKTLLPSSRKSAGATGNMLIPTLLDNASGNVMTRPSSLTVLGWFCYVWIIVTL